MTTSNTCPHQRFTSLIKQIEKCQLRVDTPKNSTFSRTPLKSKRISCQTGEHLPGTVYISVPRRLDEDKRNQNSSGRRSRQTCSTLPRLNGLQKPTISPKHQDPPVPAALHVRQIHVCVTFCVHKSCRHLFN